MPTNCGFAPEGHFSAAICYYLITCVADVPSMMQPGNVLYEVLYCSFKPKTSTNTDTPDSFADSMIRRLV